MAETVVMRAVIHDDGEGNREFAEARTTFINWAVIAARKGQYHEFGVFTERRGLIAVVPCSAVLSLAQVVRMVNDVCEKEGV